MGSALAVGGSMKVSYQLMNSSEYEDAPRVTTATTERIAGTTNIIVSVWIRELKADS